ncbi:hypothetical protein [uncultured Jannaschia sp.]|uniref:hypothetical protein n=1 Tax=uncultured Jannaschia sp. TaxID=293347 RepID=UPI002604CB55|nr:hypothetical protein [uncultured Jannaschia sp.]
MEAPRLRTDGAHLELEQAYAPMREALAARGHDVRTVRTIGGGGGGGGGGRNAIAFEPNGTMTGAACWRADGTVIGRDGGLARPDVRFEL